MSGAAQALQVTFSILLSSSRNLFYFINKKVYYNLRTFIQESTVDVAVAAGPIKMQVQTPELCPNTLK